MNELTQAAKAFADANRVRILMALRKQELCVCELCDALALTQSTLSTHLQVVRDAGLVSARKDGKWMYYTVTPGGRRLLDSLFGFFSNSLKRDARLQRDAKQLARRLAIRTNGTCCVGSTESKCCRRKITK